MVARWNFNGEADSGGDEMGRRNGESGKRNSGADSFCRGRGGVVGAAGARRGGGGGGAQSGFRRKKTAGLTDRVGPPVNERWLNWTSSVVEKTESVAMGRLGRTGREGVGRG
jgi:hypothetical protein